MCSGMDILGAVTNGTSLQGITQSTNQAFNSTNQPVNAQNLDQSAPQIAQLSINSAAGRGVGALKSRDSDANSTMAGQAQTNSNIQGAKLLTSTQLGAVGIQHPDGTTIPLVGQGIQGATPTQSPLASQMLSKVGTPAAPVPQQHQAPLLPTIPTSSSAPATASSSAPAITALQIGGGVRRRP
jgi:hypothetical protein